ncbi:hypothetical protein [Pseudomonas oryzihabitans]|uniref:hypothetical protein n=1 Tax=Pseudomonas oryzihabitans TaxID=47885 RepID=UPI002895540A|nr:hypothetical protein [Pseudomonas oryzihabitans]MDT3720327.1 hypothetical protein [Pseudomonas oryzihabitans]
MSTYRLDLNQQVLLRQALTEGGQYRCRLDRPGSSIRPYVNVELTDTSVDVDVEMGGSCNRITLPRHDSANLQALAEFVEGIANGTNDSAAPVVPARVQRREVERPQLSQADQDAIQRLVQRGGVEQLQCGVHVAVHREQYGMDSDWVLAIAALDCTSAKAVATAQHMPPALTALVLKLAA